MAEKSPHSCTNRQPGGFWDLLSGVFTAGAIGLSLLAAIIFIHPQSTFNPLPPGDSSGQALMERPSSTSQPALLPTRTATGSPTKSPPLALSSTDIQGTLGVRTPTPGADPGRGDNFSSRAASPTPEAAVDPAGSGYNMLLAAVQTSDKDRRPLSKQLAPGSSQPRAASDLPDPIPGERNLVEAPPPEDEISDLFTPEIQYWEEDILVWAGEYQLDPNLIAAVMQIESCGYARAKSVSGAMGLFQVMPQHFKKKENPYDPDTNAYRGLSWLQKTLKSGGSTSMALAGYNAGIARAKNPYLEWPYETYRYVYWGLNIYQDAVSGAEYSSALLNWLSRGGSHLCLRAAEEQQREQ